MEIRVLRDIFVFSIILYTGQNNRDLRFCFSINYLRRRRQPRLEVRGKFKKGIEPYQHPSFSLVLLCFLLLINHHTTTTQHCLFPDKEVNCNYQSLFSLLPRTHSPLFDTFPSPPLPLFRLFFLGSLAHFLSPYRSATWKFHPPVIISPPPPLPHNRRGRRLRRSKESTWRDEGRRNISLRSEFRETLLFVLPMNEKCHCWKKEKKERKRNDEHDADK